MESSSIFDKVMNYSSSPSIGGTEPKKKLKKSDELLLKIKNSGFNMSQLEGVIRVGGNQLIISIAGSGKTTALIFKIMYDIATGEATKLVDLNGNSVRVLDKIWVCTFLKSGADELQKKLSEWQRKLGVMDTSKSISFSTLHAEFKRAINGLGVETNLIDYSVNSKNLRKIVESYAITYEGSPLNSDMFRKLESAFTYTRNRLDYKRYELDIYRDLNLNSTIIDNMLRDWKGMRRGLGCVDFEDLQEILYEECVIKGNIDVINYLRNRYSYIYIDEFQDTSQIQYELLKLYAGGSKKIVAIGDDDQTIYSWRGSYNKIITELFAKDFNPTISSLTVNYRCPSNFVNAIKPSLEKNLGRFKKDLRSYNEGGTLRYGSFSDYISMSKKLSDLVVEDLKHGRSVAILCRVNSDGLIPAIMLDSLGKVKFTVSGDGMTFKSSIGRQMLSIAKLFTESSTMSVRSALNQLTWNKYEVDNILRVCKSNRVSFWEIPDEDLRYSSSSIAETLIGFKKCREQLGDIEALKVVYAYYRSEVYKKNNQYNDVCRSIIQALEVLLESSRVDTVGDFLDEIADINERLEARKKISRGSKVKIATVHEYKGKEADSVYVWNDSLGVFPHSLCNMSDIDEVEEERRIHYIACTRARKVNTILYLEGKIGYFASEMDLSKAEVISNSLSGSLNDMKKNKDLSQRKVDKILFDEDFILKPASEVSKEIYSLGKEEVGFILSSYQGGMSIEDILSELISEGYSSITIEDIKEVIYEKDSRQH